jgi:hypothetical protein
MSSDATFFIASTISIKGNTENCTEDKPKKW